MKLKDFILVLLNPSVWIRSHSTNMELDNWYRDEIEKGTRFKKIGIFRADFGGVEVWVENVPYGSFTIPNVNMLPSRATSIILSKMLVRDRINQTLNKRAKK